jgi:predicted nicotinamide N-methyase
MDRLDKKDSLDLTATPSTANDTSNAAALDPAVATNTATTKSLHHDSRDDHDGNDDIDDDSNSVSLFQVEESSLIHVQLLDRPRSLALAQYNTLHQEWGIYSTIWDGGIALLRYMCDLHSSHDDFTIPHETIQRRRSSSGSSRSSGERRRCSSSSDSSLSTSSELISNNKASLSWRDLTVIDIGSGTGLVGLGIAAASKGKALVAVTDLPLAMPLLKENAQLNRGHWTLGRQLQTPECHVLKWGQEYNDDEHNDDDDESDEYFPSKWLEQFLQRGEASSPSSPPPPQITSETAAARQPSKRKKKKNRRRYLITGADVIYRKSLFEPLLITLTALWTKLGHYANRNNTGRRTTRKSTKSAPPPLMPDVDCLLACQSIRGHLDEFWSMARKHGFDMQRIALVDLDTTSSPHAKVDLAGAVITHLLTDDDRRLPPVTNTEKRQGRIWIIRLEKLPYTFDI